MINNKIQVRLWNECYNNCTFCSLSDKSAISIVDKQIRINKLAKFEGSTIGLIGGEFFEGQLKGCENEWLNMIENISCDNLFITANLIHEQYLLNETLNIRPNILICTSYDSIGRFKTNEQKEIWLSRVNKIKNIFCTIIPTQDIINDSFINKIQCNANLCEPHLGIQWYKNIDKFKYHEHLVHDNHLFNLPKRNDFLKWIIQHPIILQNMLKYRTNHFDTIYSFNCKNELVYEHQHRFNDTNFMAPCGHPYFSRCYADSDACMQCDLEEL